VARQAVPSARWSGAGEPLNPEVIEQVHDGLGIVVRDGFGQTETTAQVGNSPGQEVVPGSMGRTLPGYEVVLLDPATVQERLGDVVEGELCLRLSSPGGRHGWPDGGLPRRR
jgi:acetyl-CoA synthetase